jgi:4a-hydroxytetrahydrobiopterin dehydratase
MESHGLSRTEASRAVAHTEWRYVLSSFIVAVPINSFAHGVELLARLHQVENVESHLYAHLGSYRLDLRVQNPHSSSVGAREVALVNAINAVIRPILQSEPDRELSVPPQLLEICIDALDIKSIRPFWKAILGYVDAPGDSEQTGALVDPTAQHPSIWFQQMDRARDQRNRIHLDVSVPHDEGERRVVAAVEAGGVLLDDSRARSFWILADREGNEACVCTWLDRDEPGT